MIPTYEEAMLPLLTLLENGKLHSLNKLVETLGIHFNLSEAERRELLPSGKQTVFRNRVGWAKTYLKKAGLLDSPKRAHYIITERGKKLLSQKPNLIDNQVLMSYPEFVTFQTPKSLKQSTLKSPQEETAIVKAITPEESLQYAHQELREKLANELLEVVKSCSPEFFENLVIDLLLTMGYGGSRLEAGEVRGKSGDGGIDGVIKEDRLGLDVIYVQAKRWEKTVPVREIRDFAGALLSQKAKKGIFITTSNFPKSAHEYVSMIEHKIVLIDGEKLAGLMIENNIGLSVAETYEVKKIDTDYFEEG